MWASSESYLEAIPSRTAKGILSSKEFIDWGQKEKIYFTVEQLFLPLGGLVII